MRRTRSIQGGRHLGGGGFTLIELLVVIGIIVILIGILIPVVSRVRESARAADSKNQISVIQNAIERYYGDFQAYPGPLPNSVVGLAPSGSLATTITPNGGSGVITGTENLVLGLCGGLYVDGSGVISFDKTKIGQGPASLAKATNAGAMPRTYSAYIDTASLDLSNPSYKDDSGTAADTNIPEFVDRFSSPMPVLYLRANVGNTAGIVSLTNGAAQYDLSDITGYTGTLIGEGKNPNKSMYSGAVPAAIAHGLQAATATASLDPHASSGYVYPYDAYPYLTNPNGGGARQKDGYILISAGPDRIYGTEDDITSFGSVVP